MIIAQAIDGTVATYITACVGAAVGLGGLWLNRISQREQNRQQRAANKVAEDRADLDETAQALAATVRRAELAEAGEDRKQKRIDQLEDEIEEERSLRRVLFSAQEARCREVQAQLTDALITLRGVVTDEIAAAAATTALMLSTPHPHQLPPPGDGDKPDLP